MKNLNSISKNTEVKTKKTWVLNKIKIATIALILGITNPVIASDTENKGNIAKRQINSEVKNKFLEIFKKNWTDELTLFKMKQILVNLDEKELLNFIVSNPDIDDIIYKWKNQNLNPENLNMTIEEFLMLFSNSDDKIEFDIDNKINQKIIQSNENIIKNQKIVIEKLSKLDLNEDEKILLEDIKKIKALREEWKYIDLNYEIEVLRRLNIFLDKITETNNENDKIILWEIPKIDILKKYKNFDKFLVIFESLDSKTKLDFIDTLDYINMDDLEIYLEINLDGSNPINKDEIELFIRENKFYPKPNNKEFWIDFMLNLGK